MEKIVRAFAPASLSCIFKPYKKKMPRWSGSFGLGFTLSVGIIVSVSKSEKTEVFLNKKNVVIPTVFDVLHRLTNQPVRISLETKLPIGSGFGISGASALATAFAVNKLLNLKKTERQLAIIAHTAEVENKTGLGDVTNQFFGGLLLKIKPSSYFSVTKISIQEKFVYCRVFSPLSTKEILSDNDLLKKIEKEGTIALFAIENELSEKHVLTLADAFAISHAFVTRSGLLQDNEVIKTIENIKKNGGSASMIILGNSVVSTISFPGAVKYEISDNKAKLL